MCGILGLLGGGTCERAALAAERLVAWPLWRLVVRIAAHHVDVDRRGGGGGCELWGALPPANSLQEGAVAGVSHSTGLAWNNQPPQKHVMEHRRRIGGHAMMECDMDMAWMHAGGSEGSPSSTVKTPFAQNVMVCTTGWSGSRSLAGPAATS